MKPCSLLPAVLLAAASPLMAQLPLANFEHPAWAVGSTPYVVIGSAASPVSRAQSFSGAQSVEIPAAITGPLNFIQVDAEGPGGGGVHFFDFRLKPSALTGPTGFGLDPATQTTWDYSILGGGLRILFVKNFDSTGAFVAKGLNGETRVLPGKFLLRGPDTQAAPGSNSLALSRSPDWIRLTIRYDSVTAKSDVFLNGYLAADSIPVSPDALPGPAQPPLAATYFKIRGHNYHPTYVDDIQVTTLNPLFNDADRDGMSDDYEAARSQSPILDDRAADPDADGIPNITETLHGTNPHAADTDSDGMPDAWEIHYGLNPVRARDAHYDLDGDGATNLEEFTASTDPLHNPDGSSANPAIVYVRCDTSGTMDGSQFNPFDNIQTALSVVADGGTIVLDGSTGPFTGYGNSNFYSEKFLHIHGVNNAVIDFEGLGGGFNFSASSSYSYGQLPIHYDPAHPYNTVEWYAPAADGHTFRDITFRNAANSGIGAISVQTSTPLHILRCTFENCGTSAAVSISDPMATVLPYYPWLLPSTVTASRIEDCSFRACTAGGLVVDSALSLGIPSPWEPGYTGPFATFWGWPSLYVEAVNCRFENNTGAPAVRITAVPSSFTNCAWRANSTGSTGGIVVISSPALPSLTHCTFLNNDGTPAGALQIIPGEPDYTIWYAWAGPVTPLTITSSIFWGNTPQQIDDFVTGGMSAYSTIQDGYYSTYSATVSTLNPLFYSGTAWLQPTSPAIDTADPASPLNSDLAHQPRTDKPGLGAPGTAADQGAYEFSPDTDGDGLADLLEEQNGLDPTNPADSAADNDADGFSNAAEITAGSNFNSSASIPVSAVNTIVLVDPLNGNDANNGFPNPVKTIYQALVLTTNNALRRTIILRDGTYSGTLNRDWNFHSLAVTIRSVNGPARTIIDLGNAGRAARIPTTQPAGLSITGLAFRNGSAPNDSTTNGTATHAEGGAFFIAGVTGSGTVPTAVTFSNCWFIACTAPGTSDATKGSGGAIRIHGHRGIVANGCQFLANKAVAYGGAVYAGTGTSFTATSSTFRFNESRASGGALYGQSSTVILNGGTDLSFNLAGADGSQNAAGTVLYSLEKDGGALYLQDPAAASQVSNCTITANAALDDGGGVYLKLTTSSPPARSTPILNACRIEANAATYYLYLTNSQNVLSTDRNGGGLYLDALTGTFTFSATIITRNECERDGGGVRSSSSSASLNSSAVIENRAANEGGGLHFSGTTSNTPAVRRCTVVGNVANNAGGGGIRRTGGTLTLDGLILWWNRASGGALATSPNYSPSAEYLTATITNSNAEGRPGAVTPSFAADRYHLMPFSPDRNTGGNSTLTDIDGEPFTASADRGCDEFVDTDSDNLPDRLERLLINASTTDNLLTLADVNPGDDYDADGFTNAVDMFYGNAAQATNTLSPPANPLDTSPNSEPDDPSDVANTLVLAPYLDDGSTSNLDAWRVNANTIHGGGNGFSYAMTAPGLQQNDLVAQQITTQGVPPSWELKLHWLAGQGDFDYSYSIGIQAQPPLGPAYFIYNPTYAEDGKHSLVGTYNTAPPEDPQESLGRLMERSSFVVTGLMENPDMEADPGVYPDGIKHSRLFVLLNGDNDNPDQNHQFELLSGDATHGRTQAEANGFGGVPKKRDYLSLTPLSAADDELVELEIRIPRGTDAAHVPGSIWWKIQITAGADKIRLWNDNKKTGQITASHVRRAYEMPAQGKTSIWIEGIKLSQSLNDTAEISLEGPGMPTHKVKIVVGPVMNGTPVPRYEKGAWEFAAGGMPLSSWGIAANLIPPQGDICAGHLAVQGKAEFNASVFLGKKGKIGFIQNIVNFSGTIQLERKQGNGPFAGWGSLNITVPSLPMTDPPLPGNLLQAPDSFTSAPVAAGPDGFKATQCTMLDIPNFLAPDDFFITEPDPNNPLNLLNYSVQVKRNAGTPVVQTSFRFETYVVFLYPDNKSILPLGHFGWQFAPQNINIPNPFDYGTSEADPGKPWVQDSLTPPPCLMEPDANSSFSRTHTP